MRVNQRACLLVACIALAVARGEARSGQIPPSLLPYEAERDKWNRPSEVIKALALNPGEAVADLGAGSGYFTLKLSKVVGPSGSVYAVDIKPSALGILRQRVAAAALKNVRIIEGRPDDPILPAHALDAVLISDAYHEMDEHQAILRAVRLALKPSGRLEILEKTTPSENGKPRDFQSRNHHIESSLVVTDLAQANFSVIDRVEKFAELPQAFAAPGGEVYWRIVAVPKRD